MFRPNSQLTSIVVLLCYLSLPIARTFNMQICLSTKGFFVCYFNDVFNDCVLLKQWHNMNMYPELVSFKILSAWIICVIELSFERLSDYPSLDPLKLERLGSQFHSICYKIKLIPSLNKEHCWSTFYIWWFITGKVIYDTNRDTSVGIELFATEQWKMAERNGNIQ